MKLNLGKGGHTIRNQNWGKTYQFSWSKSWMAHRASFHPESFDSLLFLPYRQAVQVWALPSG